MTPVTTEEAAAIERDIAGIEARTGVQVVAAVMPRSDAYPELPWRETVNSLSASALARSCGFFTGAGSLEL